MESASSESSKKKSQQEKEKRTEMGTAGDNKTEPQVPKGEDSVASEQQQQQEEEEEEKETRGGVGGGEGGREKEEEEEKAETAMLQAAAAMSMVVPEEEEKKKGVDNFDIYNKGLTSLMTFDASGHPILVPVSDKAATGHELLPTSSTVAASDDTEGQYEAVPPPQGPCAGLCPPYGALPEQMPLQRTEKKQAVIERARSGLDLAVAEAEAAGEEVEEENGDFYICRRKGRSISIYTLPSRDHVLPVVPRAEDCPVPLWQHLPPSPFINRQGEVGVDVCVIAEDLGAPDCRDAIPLYDFEAVTQAAAAAGRGLLPSDQQQQQTGNDQHFIKRLDTLQRSYRQPTEIALD